MCYLLISARMSPPSPSPNLLHPPPPTPGAIPAGGELQLRVTFTPVQYETSRITFQLIVSQFNTRPFLCTVTGCSAPHLALRS